MQAFVSKYRINCILMQAEIENLKKALFSVSEHRICVMRKPNFWLSDQVLHKPTCTVKGET